MKLPNKHFMKFSEKMDSQFTATPSCEHSFILQDVRANENYIGNSEISFLQSRAKKVDFWDNKNCDKHKKLSQFIFSFQKMQNFDLT